MSASLACPVGQRDELIVEHFFCFVNLGYRVMPRSRFSEPRLAGWRAVVCWDGRLPAQAFALNRNWTESTLWCSMSIFPLKSADQRDSKPLEVDCRTFVGWTPDHEDVGLCLFFSSEDRCPKGL